MKTSATGEFEIHVFDPEIMKPPPPGASLAVVVIPEGSEPWPGSVKPCTHIDKVSQCGSLQSRNGTDVQNIPLTRPLQVEAGISLFAFPTRKHLMD